MDGHRVDENPLEVVSQKRSFVFVAVLVEAWMSSRTVSVSWKRGRRGWRDEEWCGPACLHLHGEGSSTILRQLNPVVGDNMASQKEFEIRKAVAEDVDEILRLIVGLAVYEKEPNSVKLTREDYLRFGFGTEAPLFRCLLAEVDEPESETSSSSTESQGGGETQQAKKTKKKAVGLALYFFTFSTWEGRVLWLEDLFVEEEHRKKGIGLGLFKRLAQEAKDTDCARFQWQVLDWNTPSIDFYEKRIGGHQLKEWITMRMGRTDIDKFLAS